MRLIENFYWDADNRVCTCVIGAGDTEFYGTATCHPNDEDMKSVRTGEVISFNRAYIKYLQHIRNTTVTPILKALEDLYKNMATSYRFNENSFEAKQLRKEIAFYKENKRIINEIIASTKEYIKEYIDEKDRFYQRQRGEKAKAVLD